MSPEASRRLVLLLLVACGVVAAVLLREQISVESLAARVSALGWYAPLVFIACYAVATLSLIHI